MSQIEYITISEFASRAGVSRQTIYKQVDNRLTTYCKTVNGKKVLSTKALELFSVNKDANYKNPTVNQTDNQITSDIMQNLTSTIELLQKQLEVKDKQIQDLSNRLGQALNNQSQSNFITASQTSLLAPTEQKIEKQLQSEAEPQKKQSFFTRLFRKD